MTADTIKLSTAREIVESGSLRGTELLGRPGGYLALFKIGTRTRTLATKTGEPRIFGTLDAAVRTLRDIGIVSHIELNAAGYAPLGPLLRRRRPDSADALKRIHAAAEHDQWFRSAVELAVREADAPGAQWIEHDSLFGELEAYAVRPRPDADNR